jgi:shikimate kinase
MAGERTHTHLILIGMPAVGKSTLGVLLAKRLGFDFIDTDLVIQSGEGTRLQALIEKLGADGFCDLEAAYIRELAPPRPSVIATGGSVVYRPDAMEHLNSLGRIALLDIDIATLTSRLEHLDERGVVRMPGQTIATIYNERMPLYRRYAQITVDAAAGTPDQVVGKVMAVLASDPLLINKD